jgi:ribosomal-protein-alanine N-acetyltransferase
MLLRLLELSVELGARRMTLEVRTGNLAAQQLYHSFGFDITGRRRAYYTDDGEDAFVMTTPELATPGMRSLLETEQARRDVPSELR